MNPTLPFLPLALVTLLTPAVRTQTWLINELHTGSGIVEILNAGGASADPSGLCLWAKESFGNQCTTAGLPPFLHLRIPPGTPSVPPGGVITLVSNPSSLPCELVMTQPTSWQDRSELIAWINRDAVNWGTQILDMVSMGDVNTLLNANSVFDPAGINWSGGPVMRPGTNGCSVVARTLSAAGVPVDTDTAADWQVGPNQIGSLCAGNNLGRPNPQTIGSGAAISGTCAIQAFSNTTTELPTLTLATCSYNPRPGGSVALAVRTGMPAAPPLSCLVLGNLLATGSPIAVGACSSPIVSYLDPATTNNRIYGTLPWDPHIAADLPAIAIPPLPQLVGFSFGCQAFFFDAPPCFVRSTNALRIEIKP